MTVIRLRKRLIGAEDISFDSGNRNETFQTDGTSFPMQKLNAAHLPVGADAVAYVGKPNVSEALIDHERRLRQAAEGMSSLSEDTTITFEANSSPDSRQQRIDAIPRNLGGHLLTVVHYPETMAVTGPLKISGFYNGEIRLSGSYATYSSGQSAALSLSGCQCRVLVNGLSFSFSKTAITITGCTNVQLMDCVFIGNDTGSSKAVCRAPMRARGLKPLRVGEGVAPPADAPALALGCPAGLLQPPSRLLGGLPAVVLHGPVFVRRQRVARPAE